MHPLRGFPPPQAVFGTDGATVVPVSPTEEGVRDPDTFPPEDNRPGDPKPTPLELSAEQARSRLFWSIARESPLGEHRSAFACV